LRFFQFDVSLQHAGFISYTRAETEAPNNKNNSNESRYLKEEIPLPRKVTIEFANHL